MEKIWEELYQAAKNVQNPRDISERVSAGGVAAPFFPQVLFIPELNGTIKEVLTAKMLCDRGVAVGKFKELG